MGAVDVDVVDVEEEVAVVMAKTRKKRRRKRRKKGLLKMPMQGTRDCTSNMKISFLVGLVQRWPRNRGRRPKRHMRGRKISSALLLSSRLPIHPKAILGRECRVLHSTSTLLA